MKKISLRFSIFAFLLLFCIGMFMQISATSTENSTLPEVERQELIDKGVEMQNDILEALPPSRTHLLDPFVEATTMEWIQIAYPDIYSGFEVVGTDLILKLTKDSKKTGNASQLKIAKEIARSNGATRIRYVDYSLNELYALYAKAAYYQQNGNDIGINMAALDEANGVVVVGFEKLTQSNIEKAKKLLGDSKLLDFADFSYHDD